MKTKTKVVVVGGGVVGVSALYHLAKKGWSDVVLVERKELTSGSTWHAAGLLPLFNMSYSVGQLHKYAVDLYKKLEEETGKNVGFSVVSNIRLASTKDRMDEYHQYAGVAQTIGVDVKFLTPDQVKEIWPLCHTDDLVGAIQHPEDGYIQPADLTQAMATGARNMGAEIYRNTSVLSMKQTKDGWVVETDKGSIECEHVISCSGNFARQTGKMVGLDIPVIPVEHQYIVTEPHPEIQKRKKDGLPEMGVLRDSDSRWYMREEAGGLILGPYEDGAPACYVNGPSKDSEYELFQEDLDRLAPHIEGAIHRVPAFGLDAQRGEGAAEREAALRGAPLLPEDEVAVGGVNAITPDVLPTTTPGPTPGPVLEGNAFRTSESQVNPVDELPEVEGYMPNNPANIDRTNAILASINDILGGSEEASAMII